MLNIIQELQKRKVKNTPTTANAFQNQKEAVYVKARQDAFGAAQDGTEYLAQALDKMSQIKSQEGYYQKHLQDFLPLYNANDASVQSLLASYPTLLQDLVPRRTDEIDAASTMLMSFPKYREVSRKRLTRNARDQIDEGLDNQRVRTPTVIPFRNIWSLICIYNFNCRLRQTLLHSSNITKLCCYLNSPNSLHSPSSKKKVLLDYHIENQNIFCISRASVTSLTARVT